MGRVTAPSLKGRKEAGDPIAVLTAYDYPSAQIVDACGVDVILVGDSCATAVMGHPNTLSITVDEMVHHVKMVSSAAENALVVADMPFLSYQISPEEAVRNAGRFIAEGGAQAVKLEGSAAVFGEAIGSILDAGIPVMGHLGLTPQSVHRFGGYKVQGRDGESKEAIKAAARSLEDAGCFAIVLECIPADLAGEVTALVGVPTIGIGAGAGCDGQVLVLHDILGWKFTRFAKTFADVRSSMESAVKDYVCEVKSGAFPAKEHEYE